MAAAAAHTRSARRQSTLWGYVFNLLALIFICLPLLGLLLGAVQTEGSLLGMKQHLLPSQWTLENFAVLVGLGTVSDPLQAQNVAGKAAQFPRAFLNSVIVSGVTTTLTLLIGGLTAYSVANLRWRARTGFLYTILTTRMVPEIALVIPLFVSFRALALLNSLPGLILAEVGFFLPFAAWTLVGYFQSLPFELEEAARVDGCSRLGAFARVLLPLAAPGLAAAAVMVFMFSWHMLIVPLVLTSSPAAATLPVLLSSFVGDYFLRYTLMNASAILSMVPTVVLVLLLQRHVVSGLTAGAIKG